MSAAAFTSILCGEHLRSLKSPFIAARPADKRPDRVIVCDYGTGTSCCGFRRQRHPRVLAFNTLTAAIGREQRATRRFSHWIGSLETTQAADTECISPPRALIAAGKNLAAMARMASCIGGDCRDTTSSVQCL